MQFEKFGMVKIIFIFTLPYIGFNSIERKNEDYKEQLVESILRGER